MAARRLIAVMLVLLFLSSLAAALAPVERDSETTSTTTTLPEPGSAGRGKLLRERLDAGAEHPRTIAAAVGDQLQLRVAGPSARTVELVGLGADEDVAPGAPAHFDVLLGERGDFPVRILETRREIGVIVVSPPRAPTEQGPARARDRP